MIIRSQDKLRIETFNNAEVGHGCNAVYVNGLPFGVYSTEAKAIKVLDMIQQEYGRHFYGQGGQMATADIYIQPFAFIPPKMFQMPSDEEVEV